MVQYVNIDPPVQTATCAFWTEQERYSDWAKYVYTVYIKFDNFRLNNTDIYCDYTINVAKVGKKRQLINGQYVWKEDIPYNDAYFNEVTFMSGIDILHNEETIIGVPFPVKLGTIEDVGERVTFELSATSWYWDFNQLVPATYTKTDEWHIQVLIPSFVAITAPTIETYNKNISLGGNGYYDYTFDVNNPSAISYALKQANTYLINKTTDTSRTISNFRWRKYPDVDRRDINPYQFIIEFDYPQHSISGEYYYFTDQDGKFHSDSAGTITSDTIVLPFNIIDNPSIFTINNGTVVNSVLINNNDVNVYAVDNTKFKLVYDFTYNDITDNRTTRYRIRLINGGNQNEVFIDEYITKTTIPDTMTGTFYSAPFETSEVIQPMVEITPYYGNSITYNDRKYTKTFPVITVYPYSLPRVSFFDVFPSTATGDSDLTSTHASYLGQYNFSDCGGWNSITAQRFEIYEETDPTTIVQTYDNPELVSGNTKYIAAITYDISKNYIVKFIITDRFGHTSSKDGYLKYKGGVIMDFNKTGYGMAIGKYSESDILEINLPTIFYDDVEYIGGRRLTTDAARDLGCTDTYNVGATNIQAMLDYLVNAVLNS